MKQIRYLKNAQLYSQTYAMQTNGTRIVTRTLVKEYTVQPQEITDDISASIYGASIKKMLRLSSPMNELETYLEVKMSPIGDNITKYIILYNGKYYNVITAQKHWIDVEFAEVVPQQTV